MVAIAALLLFATTALAEPPTRYAGRRLDEVLRALQASGLRIVFSSEMVTPDMRVTAEPHSKRAREVLDELLKPHGLKAQDGPAGIIQVIRVRVVDAPRPADVKKRTIEKPAAGNTGYREHVTVTVPDGQRREPGIGSIATVGRSQLDALAAGAAADDPMRTVQAMPFVSADDLRSDVSVRGSPYRHIAIAVDGIATPWLQHAIYATGETASLGMLNSLVVDEVTLRSGVYPHRYDNKLGAQVDIALREGSRTAAGWQGSIGSTHVAVAGDGPLGRSQRGSWLGAFRQSYREWPNTLTGQFSARAFGFSDAQTKFVYDARPGQQLGFSALVGRSVLDERGDGGPDDLAVASSRTAAVNAVWRSSLASRFLLDQRVSVVAHQFLDTTQARRETASGRDRQLSYRATATRAFFSTLIEGGVQAESLTSRRTLTADSFAGSTWLRSGYVNVRWAPLSGITVAPGMRVADSTLLNRHAISRWILTEWSPRAGWTLNASASTSNQFPDIQQTLGATGTPNLKPEHATQVDLGVEHRVTKSIFWQATVFHRRERDGLREPDLTPRLVDGLLTEPSAIGRYENALSGSSQGVELLLQRSAAIGLSGWLAYSYGRTRSADVQRGDSYWADFDQRHGVNAVATYRFLNRTGISVKFRAGSNFPIPAYVAARDGQMFVSDRRNEVRLPGYARLDVRASRTFDYSKYRFTLFADVVNVLNRTNVGLAEGFVNRQTGAAVGFTRTLFPRLPSAGLLIEF